MGGGLLVSISFRWDLLQDPINKPMDFQPKSMHCLVKFNGFPKQTNAFPNQNQCISLPNSMDYLDELMVFQKQIHAESMKLSDKINESPIQINVLSN